MNAVTRAISMQNQAVADGDDDLFELLHDLLDEIDRLHILIDTERTSNDKTLEHNNRLINEVDRLKDVIEELRGRYLGIDRTLELVEQARKETAAECVSLADELYSQDGHAVANAIRERFGITESPWRNEDGH